ncbi:uncharacterized protein BKA78DRAFT_302690 [Phyllosticta capitalensis]|uniref:uncharacterized protein n=1 Tax=Phyllosticta capitalensis TaxID=121624 RepID=UPI00312FA09A
MEGRGEPVREWAPEPECPSTVIAPGLEVAPEALGEPLIPKEGVEALRMVGGGTPEPEGSATAIEVAERAPEKFVRSPLRLRHCYLSCGAWEKPSEACRLVRQIVGSTARSSCS